MRIAIYAKELDVVLSSPPADWPRSARYRAINPTGLVPVLICDDGSVIPESTVILEYLEEQFPEARPLLPFAASDRAKVRLLARLVDLYLMSPVVALAKMDLDESGRRAKTEEIVDALRIIEDVMGIGAYSVSDDLTLADCALAPALFAVGVTGERLGLDLIAGNNRVDRYAWSIEQDEHVRRVLLEMTEGLRMLAV